MSEDEVVSGRRTDAVACLRGQRSPPRIGLQACVSFFRF
jgi:hypothetical protein